MYYYENENKLEEALSLSALQRKLHKLGVSVAYKHLAYKAFKSPTGLFDVGGIQCIEAKSKLKAIHILKAERAYMTRELAIAEALEAEYSNQALYDYDGEECFIVREYSETHTLIRFIEFNGADIVKKAHLK